MLQHGRVYRVLKVGTKYDANGTAVSVAVTMSLFTYDLVF